MDAKLREALRKNIPEMEVFVLAGRGVNRVLSEWLKIIFKPEQVHVFDPREEIPDRMGDLPAENICAGRNEIVRRFLETSQRRWLVSFDDDMYPVPETLEMLACDCSFAGCHVWGKKGGENHREEDVVCMSAVKISRDVLRGVTPPYFTMEPADGKKVTCECISFSQKVRELGHTPNKIGYVGHTIPFVVTMMDGMQFQMVQESQFPPPKPENYRDIVF